MTALLYILDLSGVAVFAITGTLAVRHKKLDLFGVVVVAVVTAIGGGTLRDVLLGRTPVFWVKDAAYLVVAGSAAVVTVVFVRFINFPRRALLIADALGLGLFTVLGADIALDAGVHPAIAAAMGVMSGTAGGVIRDLLANEIPLILRKEIYAIASLCGAVVYIVLLQLSVGTQPAALAGAAITFVLRVAAIRWRWSFPVF
ncbi:MAG: trimeric intracellular cation channel family protein [Chloroflexi bacterium]|nr:MAG: trimeric intracellular cation channel family protein [Chloroflexota bacterium]